MNNEELLATADNLFEKKCIAMKQQNFFYYLFELNENYEIGVRTRKCDYLRCPRPKTPTMNTPDSQLYINLPREDSVISLLNSYLDLNFELNKKIEDSR